MTNSEKAALSRRTFVKGSALAGLGAAAMGSTSLFGCAPQGQGDAEGADLAATGETAPADEKIVWTHCHVNCGGACVLQCHVADDEIVSVESDNTGDASFGGFQARACLRGRSIRRWINGEDRLNYPMKRVEGSKRGEGKYEQISWDEALDTIASEFKRITEAYGNESVFIQECSGVEQNVMMNNPWFRLFNLCGGVVTRYGNYSNGALTFGAQLYTYGGGWGKRSFKTLADGELVVMFGNAPCDTRMAGDGHGYDLLVAMEQKNVRVISIDPRRSEIATNRDVEWIPIRPGTDAALVAGIAHELIKSDMVDLDFLHTYCVGYDEETLPQGAPANSSYYAYVMGTGYDMVEKTPAWAAAITQIPEQRIIDLAHEIGEAKPCFICQGWGPQRRTNGETAARAIALLPQLVGQVGLPSTNSGLREGNGGFSLNSLPTGDNPITAKFPNYLWPEAIKDGTKLTALNAGIQGADALPAPIKMMINYGNNMPANQNGDINFTTDILRDDSLCEFIVCYDVVMTDSAKYADIILPDLTPQETWTLSTQGENNDTQGIWFGQPTASAKFERREVYEVCADLADRLGVKDAYTDGGKTREDWCRELYEEFRAENPDAPTWEEGLAAGIYKKDIEVDNATDPFIEDPAANPLETATGKIQIYSPELAEYAATWELQEGDVICPIPIYVPGFDGPDSNTEEHPLQFTGYHTKAHTHSSYANNQIIQDAHRHNVWINPLDAAERNIETGDMVRVFNDHGEILIEAKVTDRIMPGVGAIPQGMWHDADMDGDRVDKGGCINTLTSRHCTPVAKATGQHTIIGQIAKA